MKTAEKKTIEVPCDICGCKGSARIGKKGDTLQPSDWTRHNGKLWCPGCWSQNFAIRAITVPMIGDVVEGGTKDELWAALREAWRACGQAMNWATTMHYVADEAIRSTPQSGRLPSFKAGYYYPEIARRWPILSSGSASQLDRRSAKLYRAGRLEIFRMKRSLASYRDQPLPLRSKDFSIDRQDNRTTISFRVGGRRWTIPIGGRAHFGRQLAALDKIIDGSARQVESRIVETRCGSTHRGADSVRDSGGQKAKSRIDVTIVCWLPKAPERVKALNGTLMLRTHGTSFLSARMKGGDRDERWTHEDHVRRWVAAHRRRLHRLRDDQKVERRVGLEPNLQSFRERITNRHERRMDDFVKAKSTQVATLAGRLGVAEVVYDDSDRSWVASFPWFIFWKEVQRKLGDRGIKLLTLDEKKEQMASAKQSAEWAAMLNEISLIGKETKDDDGNDGNGINGN